MAESGLSWTARTLAGLLTAGASSPPPRSSAGGVEPVCHSRERRCAAADGPADRPDASLLTLELVEASVAHGVAPLLYHALAKAARLDRLGSAARARLVRAAQEARLIEWVQRRDLEALLGAFDREGLRPLVMKGAALAATHYEEGWLRPRGDADLLVPADGVHRARSLLEHLGCRRALRPEGRSVTHQARYVRDVSGVPVAYDLHWRVMDPEAFAHALRYDELDAEARPGAAAGERHPSPVHGLLLACAHRVAHHHDSDRLLFVCDIDRLARGLDDAGWRRFAGLAADRGLRRVCRRGLALASDLFETPVPVHVREAFDTADVPEPTAVYVRGGLRRVDILRSDLQQLRGWRARAGLIREHLFPDASYVLAQYGCRCTAAAPFLYLDRMIRGGWQWFRPLAAPRTELPRRPDGVGRARAGWTR
jgi:hypothetical protein